MNLRKRSLFSKYIIAYSFIVLLSCLLIGFILSYLYLRNLNGHARSSSQIRAELAMADLENQLDNMHQLSLELSVQKSFHPSSFRTDKVTEMKMLEALHRYQSYLGPASEFALIYWIDPSNPDAFLSSGQKSDIEVFLGRYEFSYDDEMLEFLHHQHTKGRVCVGSDNILIAYPVMTDVFLNDSSGTLCFAVNKSSLLKRIKLTGNLAADDCCLYYNDTPLTQSIQNRYSLMITSKSGFSLEVQYSHVTLPQLITSFDNVSILLIVVAILFIVIVILAYICYSPIKKLVRKYSSGEKQQSNELIILDDIIQHLQTDSETLGRRSSSQSALMRNYLLLMLLNNVSTQHLEEDLSTAGINFPNPLFAVITLRPLQRISHTDMEVLAHNIYEFSEDDALLYVTESNPERQVLSIICNFDIGLLGTIEKKLDGYLQYQPFTFVMGTGQTTDAVTGISASYLTAQRQMEKSTASDISDAPSDLKATLESIRKDLHRGDSAAAMLDVSYYLDMCTDETSELLRRYNLFNLKRTVQQVSEELNYKLSDEQLSALLVANDRQSASSALNNLIDTICVSVREQSDHAALSVAQMVINYLKEHFCEYDISAHQAAEALGIGINRANSIIREMTGDTCKVYITRLRMEYAADLLANSDISISEISEKIGYASVSHFIKLFKDAYGITPDNYRKNKIQIVTIE